MGYLPQRLEEGGRRAVALLSQKLVVSPLDLGNISMEMRKKIVWEGEILVWKWEKISMGRGNIGMEMTGPV